MRRGFFRKTAWENVKRNYRFFVPAMLAGAGLIACFTIVYTLKSEGRLSQVSGGDYIPFFMSLGTAVIAFLSVVLIFYANSFLMRQRTREYGLYVVLGMEKRHATRILFHETAVEAAGALALGIPAGALFYRLSTLLVCRLLKADGLNGFGMVSVKSVLGSALFFVLIYLAAFLVNLRTLGKMNAVELLKSRETGEKEPEQKTAVFLAGLVMLLGGYAISVFTKQPLKALALFFIAVFLVIGGTYCLYRAGSVFVLKKLRGNKKFYYSRKHMAPVSGLLFRMKQNAAGLASVAILATGVLVMVSTTVSLYAGMERAINASYPDDLYVTLSYETEAGEIIIPTEKELEKLVTDTAEKTGLPIEQVKTESYLECTFMVRNGSFIAEQAPGGGGILSMAEIITEETYRALTGKTPGLQKGETAMARITVVPGNTPDIGKSLVLAGETLHVKETLDSFPVRNGMQVTGAPVFGFVVADEETLSAILENEQAAYGKNASPLSVTAVVRYKDKDAGEEAYPAFEKAIRDGFGGTANGAVSCLLDTRADAEEAVTGMYGTLLFLGIVLGLVCLFATVLIIYYKQISEGYEDRERYRIMQKAGMSGEEVRDAIRAQTLLVFFLPLVTAGVHTAFAFPILDRLLHILMLPDTRLFLICSLISFAVFAAVYSAIYTLTARTYYKIVK